MGRRGGPRRGRRRGERAAGATLPRPLGPPRARGLSGRGLVLAAALLPLAGCAATGASDAGAAFAEWRRELAATLESPLDEPSGREAGAELEHTRLWLQELRAIPPDRLGPEDRLDWRFAESLLAGREIALADRRPWARDPAHHLPVLEIEAAVAAAGAGDPAALDALLDTLPERLAHGRAVLEVHVPRLRERALRLSLRAVALIEETGRPAAGTALRALEEWLRFLRETLPERPRSTGALGAEAYSRLLGDQHLLPRDPLALWRRAERGLRESAAALEALAGERSPGSDWRAMVRREIPASGREDGRAALEDARQRARREVDAARDGHPRLLRRRFGSRLFEEAWPLYAERRLLETGADADALLQAWALAARRAAGLAVDVGLHTGRLDVDEAAALLRARGGLSADEARDEVDAALARPGRNLGLAGLDALLSLREDLRRREGDAFERRSFDERILGVGSLPPTLLREAVLAASAAVDRTTRDRESNGS